MTSARRSHHIARRGNALILVAGILVLLVIMATVFLSRTGTLRALGTAQRQTAFHGDRRESAASGIAQELAESLFVRPLDFTSVEYDMRFPPDEQRRLVSGPEAPRYGVDPAFTWNRAPWEVIAWTNPPDWLTYPLRPGKLRAMEADNSVPEEQWPAWQWWDTRVDSDDGGVDLFRWPGLWEDWPPEPVLPNQVDPLLYDVVLQPRENPLGGPGISDTRWLRDIEPQRMPVRALHNPNDSTPDGTDSPTNFWSDRLADAYSHWRHLSWIARPGNAWRMCPDIADVTGVRTLKQDSASWDSTMTDDGIRHAEGAWVDGRRYYGGIYDRMDVPIEQWPAMMPTAPRDFSPQQDRFWPGGVMARLTDPEEFSFGDSATSVFVPENDDVVMPRNPVDMSTVQGDNHLLDFWDRWLAWLRPEGYKQALIAARAGNGNLIPPNFYDLDDLDGDGKRGEYYDPATMPWHEDYDPDEDSRWGETPVDEFRPDTARWHVSRILTDTDGDGFTDSFWWLSPHVGVDGTRQVIGVSVTDNSGRLNANVATRSMKNDDPARHESTRGWTPSDLALVSQNFSSGADGDGELEPEVAVWNTGYFDIEAHQPPYAGEWTFPETQDWHGELTVPFVTYPGRGLGSGFGWSQTQQRWSAKYWQQESNRAFLEGTNIDTGGNDWNPFFPDQVLKDIKDRDNRLYYFQQSGQEPQHPSNIFTPFNLADELELRANEGNNHGGVYSRLERMLGPSVYGSNHILRGTFADRGSGEAAEKLDNRQLAHDLRHRLTLFNGARNETLPPHLWWEHRAPDPRADDIVVGGELEEGDELFSTYNVYVEDMHERFHDQMRQKLDLREWERAARPRPALNTEYDPRTFSERLSQSLLLGLTSGDVTDKDPRTPFGFDVNVTDPGSGGDDFVNPVTGNYIPILGGRDSYFGQGDGAWEKTRRLAAALTANILASRDPDQDAPLLTMEGKLPPDPDIPFPGAPTLNNWHGEIGAIPLPFFEGAYYPLDLAAHNDAANKGDIVFPGGETVGVGQDLDADHLNSDLSYASESMGNRVSDYVDLSDISRPKSAIPDPAIPPLEPWELVCVGIDGDGDGWTDWVEKRPWVDAVDDTIIGLVRMSDDPDAPCPTPFMFNHLANNPNLVQLPAWQEHYAPEVHMLGMEPQPFISEVFFAEVAKAWRIGQVMASNTNSRFVENFGGALWVTAADGQEHLTEADDPDVPFVHPSPSQMVVAVQLVNPYDVAIPLMERDVDGQLQPLYSLRFLRANRLDPTSKAKWEIPLDPTLIIDGDEDKRLFRTSTDFVDPLFPVEGDPTPRPYGSIAAFDPIPMLPPATNDRPYSLLIVLNGVENWKILDEPHWEDMRWLDFLDFRRDRHPFGDLVQYPDGETRNIEPGELLWRIDPVQLQAYFDDMETFGGMTDPLEWYYKGTEGISIEDAPKYSVPDPSSEGLPLDPRQASMVELVRTHRRQWSANSGEATLPDYTADVVIDRTVGSNGMDELSHVVTMQLATHRLPSIKDVSPQSLWAERLPEMAAMPLAGAANSIWTEFLVRYPRLLQSAYGLRSGNTPGSLVPADQDNPTRDAGFASLKGREGAPPSAARQGLLIEPEDARWMQWARYGRAWAVDDYENTTSTGTGPVFADVQEAGRRLWRPDRAAPRFVAADGRVTMSWSPQWAAHFGLMPQMDEEGWGPLEANASFPVYEGLDSSDPNFDPTHTTQFADWMPEQPLVRANETSHDMQLALFEAPILVSSNLATFGPARAVAGQPADSEDIQWEVPPTRLMRRWAEQKMGMAPGRTPADASLAGVIGEWDTWYVNDDGEERHIHVFVDGDPVNDWDRDNDGLEGAYAERLPANLKLLKRDPDQAFPNTLIIDDQWELYWHRINDSGYGQEGSEYFDTYANALRFRHGHIYSVNWDPDGFGRDDVNGDGFLDDDTATAGYTATNPYPYPWATRNVRLPWKHVDEDEVAGSRHEYYLFQAHKPHFFSFNPRRLDGNANVVNLDSGYEPGDLTNPMPWSYPDKGYYGPAEIDGDILMPFGFQVQLKDANFEQVGEVLEVPSIAHELYVKMEQPAADPGDPEPLRYSWPADYYNEWPPSPDLTRLDQIQTLKTYSEQLAEELAARVGPSAGHLQLRGTMDGPNAIVGDPRTTHEVIHGQLVTYEPYDLKTGRGLVPDWYLGSDNVAHIDPDLPATQRLLDMFVCDGPGIYDLVRSDPTRIDAYDESWTDVHGEPYGDGFIDDPEDWQLFADPWNGQLSVRSSSFDNAGGFEGRPTRGLVNINTAPVEVLRTLPHLYRMVHADPHSDETPLLDNFSVDDLELERPFSPHPRTAVPEAIVQFRDGLGQLPRYDQENQFDPLNEPPLGAFDSSLVTGVPDAAPYSDRGVGLPRDWWGVDQFPNTGDDLIADLDVTYSSNLKNRYNNPAFADVDADETIRFSRGTRGFAGIGELFQLSRPAFYDYGFIDEDGDGVEDGDYREPLGTSVAADAWRMDWSGRNPFGYQDKQVHGENGTLSGGSTLWDDRSDVDSDDNRLRDAMSHPGAFLSTDTDRSFDTQVPELSNFEHVASWPAGLQWVDPLGGYGGFQHAGTDDPRYRELHLTGDRVAGDAEEQSLLFSGISNMITTRSDVFTVHLRVRTFKRNPESGVWDATDRDQIVDDARYVMVVDRSEVDRPGDRPRILMLQRIDD